MMIDLTGKNVFVRTREEYLSVLKIARFQGFKWARENHLNHIEIPFPNILIFYDNKIATYSFEKELLEASKIVEDEKKIKDAVKLVRTFAKYPDRTTLTDSFIKSLKLLADTVESQMEEVKQMERLTIDDMIKALRCVASQDTEGDCYKDHENFKHMKDDKYKRIVCGTGENLKDWISGRDAVGCPYHQKTYGTCYEDGELYWLKDVAELLEELKSYKGLEEQGLLVRLPCKVGDTVYRVNAGAKQPIIPMTVSEIHFLCYKNERAVRFDAIGKEDMGESCYRLEDIGRIVFLTHEEAEKLEEMKNND